MREIDDNEELDNILYYPSLANYIVRHFMAFLCMWSGIIIKFVLPNVSRVSNAYVESHFKTVNNTVLNCEIHLPIARFVRKMKKYIIDTVKQEKFATPLKSRKVQADLYPMDIDITEENKSNIIPKPLDPSV